MGVKFEGGKPGRESNTQSGKLIRMATLTIPRAIPVCESLLRREAVMNALADLRLEGLAPSSGVQAVFERFVQGELTHEELVAAVLAQ